MPLSSVLGASTLIKPGVVTSSTRPSVPYEGQLIYETDTDRIAAYNGAAWVTQNGLQLIKTQTIGSAVSTATVSNVFSSAYDNYLIIASGITFSVAATEIRATWNGSSGSTYNSWGFFTTAGLAVTGSGGASQASAVVGVSSSGLTSVVTQIQNPFAASATQWQSTYGGQTYGGLQNGADTNAASSTDYTIRGTTGTMTGGTIRVYGYANT